METSFLSGSENLYKYLVTIGILMVVLTIYYPLQEKQSLEVEKIKLENELEILKLNIVENKKKVDEFKIAFMDSTISSTKKYEALEELKAKNKENQINQINSINKNNEINTRKAYIKTYKILFWFFLPLGIFLIVFGFIKWNLSKKTDDRIQNLEERKLSLEVDELEKKVNP